MAAGLAYWEKRKAREAYEMYVGVEKAAQELTDIYAEAAAEIEQEARRIFRRFQIENALTEKQAEKLLMAAADPAAVKAILQELKKNPANAELVTQLQGYTDRINKLAALQKRVDRITSEIFMGSGPAFRKVLRDVALGAYYREIFGLQQRAGAAFMFSTMTAQHIESILSRPWSGENYSRRIWQNTKALSAAVKRELVKGMLTGKSAFRMSQAIDDLFHRGASNARRLMRTESNYVANQVTIDAYKEAGVDTYIYVAILDLRTSMICREMDKKRFLVKNAMPGKNYPPMHPWCRSTTIAWMPEELLRQLQQSAIDPNTGQRITVPGDMTYAEWYDKYVTPKETPPASTPPDPVNVEPKPANPQQPEPAKPGGEQDDFADRFEKFVKEIDAEKLKQAGPEEVKNDQPFQLGEPMSFKDADGGNVNPKYKGGGEGYKINCQSCVPVYEARRRGYNVEALPKENSFQQRLAVDEALAWRDPATGYPPKIEHCGCKSAAEVARYINETITPGERYTLSLTRRDFSGHIVALEYVDGAPAIYDPQNGEIAHNIKRWLTMQATAYRYYGSDISPAITNISRLDLSPGLLEHIAKAKK